MALCWWWWWAPSGPTQPNLINRDPRANKNCTDYEKPKHMCLSRSYFHLYASRNSSASLSFLAASSSRKDKEKNMVHDRNAKSFFKKIIFLVTIHFYIWILPIKPYTHIFCDKHLHTLRTSAGKGLISYLFRDSNDNNDSNENGCGLGLENSHCRSLDFPLCSELESSQNKLI